MGTALCPLSRDCVNTAEPADLSLDGVVLVAAAGGETGLSPDDLSVALLGDTTAAASVGLGEPADLSVALLAPPAGGVADFS